MRQDDVSVCAGVIVMHKRTFLSVLVYFETSRVSEMSLFGSRGTGIGTHWLFHDQMAERKPHAARFQAQHAAHERPVCPLHYPRIPEPVRLAAMSSSLGRDAMVASDGAHRLG